MSVNPGNLAGGPATLYSGAYSATAALEPSDAQVNGTPAASAWTDAGGTLGGLTLNYTQKFLELTVDQITEVCERRKTNTEVSIDTQLAEITAANMALAIGTGTLTTGANFASFDPGDSVAGLAPTYKAFVMDGQGPSGFKRRVFLRKAISTANVKEMFALDKQNVVPVTFTAHYVSSTVRSWRYVDQTS